MAFQPLSIGDILMLSQTAWKIGRAFTQGKKSAPAEFAEVEREANGLSDALKLVAETLHSDGSVLSHADNDVKAAVAGILESAHKTLDDLDSFVERYQVIKRQNTNGGFVVERSWSDVVVANYKTFKWTTEGGDITELRNMLQMHTNSINLTMQALQSRSLSRLERTVVPMAEKISDVHDRVNGDLGDKIDDLHRIIMSIANATPSLVARDRSVEYGGGSIRDSTSTISTLDKHEVKRLEPPPSRSTSFVPPRFGSRDSSRSPIEAAAKNSNHKDSAYYPPSGSHSPSAPRERMDWDFESGSPSQARRGSIGAMLEVDAGASPKDSAYVPVEPKSRRGSHRRESATLPVLMQTPREDFNATPGSSRQPVSPASPISRQKSSKAADLPPLLGPPAIAHNESENSQAPATPSTFFNSLSRVKSDFSEPATPRPRTAGAQSLHRQSQPQLASSAAASFERHLFRNAAILCDVRGKLVEYAQDKPDEPDPRYNVEMVPACQEARICVIRKRENRDTGGMKAVTSVWTLSEDGEVRLQHKLSETLETVPYCSYFDPEKVSLQPAESPIALRFHSTQWGAELKEEVKTNWVNYYFQSENDAVSFQSAVFGRMLIGSFRTTKTTVIHEGLRGAFAFEEQFANIEMLRLWEDDGISTPGAAGGVMALMHISSNFGDGWARWWINNNKQQIKVKGDGLKHARVKGIDVTVAKPARFSSASSTPGDGPPRPEPARTMPIRTVNGVKIEFKSEEERLRFLVAAKKAQERLVNLPPL